MFKCANIGCAKRSLGTSKRGAIFHRLNSMATGDRLQHDHRSGMKTFGPAGTALLNLAAMIWLLS
jgi:hypothetical protein